MNWKGLAREVPRARPPGAADNALLLTRRAQANLMPPVAGRVRNI
jgi:hypothetical protein